MQGPRAAVIRSGAAPSAAMAASAASSTPSSAPCQPAWAAPITPASGSASRTGPQSAVSTPSSRPGRSVTSASASGAVALSQGAVTASVVTPCTWRAVTSVRRRDAQGRRGAAPGSGDARGLVAAAQAHVERGPDALADAARAGEEGVPHAGHGRQRIGPQHHRRLSPASKPGGTNAPGAASAMTRNSSPICSAADQARAARGQGLGLLAGVARSSRARSRSSMPEPAEERRLADRPVDRGTARPARGERGRESRHGRKGRPRPARPAGRPRAWRRTAWKVSPVISGGVGAVVDQQRQPALRRQPQRQGLDQRLARRRQLHQRAVGEVGADLADRLGERRGSGREHEAEGARRVDRDQALVPAARPAHELPDRQRVQELVGDQQQRPVRGQAGQLVVPAHRQAAQGSRPAARARPGWSRPDAR